MGDLRKYFDRVFPVLKCEYTYPGVRSAFDGCKDRLIQHTEYDLRAASTHITQELAKDDGYAMSYPQTNIKIALKCHPLNNRFKCKAMTATSWSAKRNLAVYIEFEESMIEVGDGYLRNVIQGKEFESMYGAKVRLCPVISCSQTEETKERIWKCQACHRITMHNITSNTKLGIEVFRLDTRSKQISLTLRQMIMEQRGKNGKRLFVSI
eukprot:14109150-Ditylum_brightwellii.AAC.3